MNDKELNEAVERLTDSCAELKSRGDNPITVLVQSSLAVDIETILTALAELREERRKRDAGR